MITNWWLVYLNDLKPRALPLYFNDYYIYLTDELCYSTDINELIDDLSYKTITSPESRENRVHREK